MIVTGTQQARNPKKNQTWWIPTFTISRWNEPDGTGQPLESASQVTPNIEAVEAKPPRERKPRNAYQHLNNKQEPAASMKDTLDDEIPF